MGGKPSKQTKADQRLRENQKKAKAEATANRSTITRRGKPL